LLKTKKKKENEIDSQDQLSQEEKDIDSKITLLEGCIEGLKNLLHKLETKESLNNSLSSSFVMIGNFVGEFKPKEEFKILIQPSTDIKENRKSLKVTKDTPVKITKRKKDRQKDKINEENLEKIEKKEDNKEEKKEEVEEIKEETSDEKKIESKEEKSKEKK